MCTPLQYWQALRGGDERGDKLSLARAQGRPSPHQRLVVLDQLGGHFWEPLEHLEEDGIGCERWQVGHQLFLIGSRGRAERGPRAKLWSLSEQLVGEQFPLTS